MDRKSTRTNKPAADHEADETMRCDLCHMNMELKEATFAYLGRTFKHKVLRCPACGQVYVSEDLAKGRMREVEGLLEDK